MQVRVKASTPIFRWSSVTPDQVTPVTRVTAPEVSSLHTPSPKSCSNTSVFRCSSVTPDQVTPVTRVKAPEVPSLQTTEATVASHSLPSVNIQANLNFSSTVGTYIPSLSMQLPASSPARSRDYHFRNFCNFTYIVIFSYVSPPLSPA